MPKKPTILETEILLQSKLFKCERIHLRFNNDNERYFERIRPKTLGAVIIVPLLDNDTFCLVREYAIGSERYELGLPKGLIDAGETPEEAANRELQEEIGYAAKQLTRMKRLSLAPGFMSHATELVLARDLYPNTLEGDEPEPLEMLTWRFSELDYLLSRDDFTEARSIAALYMTKEFLNHDTSK